MQKIAEKINNLPVAFILHQPRITFLATWPTKLIWKHNLNIKQDDLLDSQLWPFCITALRNFYMPEIYQCSFCRILVKGLYKIIKIGLCTLLLPEREEVARRLLSRARVGFHLWYSFDESLFSFYRRNCYFLLNKCQFFNKI